MAANGRKTRANHVGRLENSTLLPGGIMFYNPPDSYTPSRSQLFRGANYGHCEIVVSKLNCCRHNYANYQWKWGDG